jgi:hypothetical protein
MPRAGATTLSDLIAPTLTLACDRAGAGAIQRRAAAGQTPRRPAD